MLFAAPSSMPRLCRVLLQVLTGAKINLFSILACNFLMYCEIKVRKLFKGGNYSRAETTRGNMVSVCVSLRFSRLILLEIYIYLRETSSSSNLHSCIQSQDCRPLQNIVKYYTKCMNPMKRMEQSKNVEKALDCDKNTYTAG